MKPIYVLVPYWMGEFNPSQAAIARHNWRLLTPAIPDGSPTERMGVICHAVADEVARIRAEGNLPVIIQADCTSTIGVMAGLQRESPDFTLVWYDAHGDFNTHETTPSGFIGGMPLAMLCGRGEQTIMAGAGARIHPETDIILTDGRDLDPEEAETLAQSAITHLPDVAGLSSFSLPGKAIYIHFDSDVLSSTDMAATNYLAKGGASLETIEASLSSLAQTKRVITVSITTWSPELDEDGSADQLVTGVVERLVTQLY